jgi:hypothetical protein
MPFIFLVQYVKQGGAALTFNTGFSFIILEEKTLCLTSCGLSASTFYIVVVLYYTDSFLNGFRMVSVGVRV